jgi:hypothetical protein
VQTLHVSIDGFTAAPAEANHQSDAEEPRGNRRERRHESALKRRASRQASREARRAGARAPDWPFVLKATVVPEGTPGASSLTITYDDDLETAD